MASSKQEELEVWKGRLEELTPDELWRKAGPANSPRFVRALVKQGMSGAEIEALFAYWVHLLRRADLPIPSGGYFDLNSL
jgi:hypothetical protein